MAIAIRGTTPGTTTGTTDPLSLNLTGTRQPAAGDVLIIIHGNDFYALSAMATPTVGGSSTGVTVITNGTADNGTDQGHCKSYSYVVGATGDLTVAVDETGSADEEKVLIVYVLSGADIGTPIDIAGVTLGTTPSTSHVAPTISPTSSDAFLICHVNTGPSSGGAYTPPGGMSSQYDIDGGAMRAAGATLQLVASGATGTKTFTTGNVTYVGLSIAVMTAAGTPPPELEEGPVVNVTRSSNRFA